MYHGLDYKLTKYMYQLVTQACLALCGLMTDEVGRVQFIEKDGYLRILRALSCPETVVPLAFVPFISVNNCFKLSIIE